MQKALPVIAKDTASSGYRMELLRNQTWQILNFASKAGFLILLTPLMISKWGSEGYGLFALASSLLVSMALLDGGIRALTRVGMSGAWKNGDEDAALRIYSEGILTFASVAMITVFLSVAVSLPGWTSKLLHLRPGQSTVLVLAVACTAVLMTTLLGLEPLAARGNLSSLKASNTVGALAAIPVCAGLLWLGGGVGMIVIAYALCLTVPNIVIAKHSGILSLARRIDLRGFGPRIFWNTLRSGIWYYLTTISLVGKTHGLTFLVSALAGPAEAGIFYIFLRLTEIVGNVGATASETSLAALASAQDRYHRETCFRHSWLHVSVFCVQGGLVFLFLTIQLISLWLPERVAVSHSIGFSLAVFGLSGAFSRVVVNSAMGVGLTYCAAVAGVWEALVSMAFAAAGYAHGGLSGLFLGGSLGIVCLFPAVGRISREWGWNSPLDWINCMRPLLPGFLLAAIILVGASWSTHSYIWLSAVALCALIAVLQLRKIS